MAGSKTIYSYCLVDGPLAYTGSKFTIVNKFFDYELNSIGEAVYNRKGSNDKKVLCKYLLPEIHENAMSIKEIHDDIVEELFKLLVTVYKMQVYVDIGYTQKFYKMQ
jgi:hypothetical protein